MRVDCDLEIANASASEKRALYFEETAVDIGDVALDGADLAVDPDLVGIVIEVQLVDLLSLQLDKTLAIFDIEIV